MKPILLALDFGGTKHAAATAILGKRQWLAYQRILSPADANARSDLENVIAIARQVLDGATPGAVGVSFGGPVDATTGTVRLSHHVPGWENIPLRQLLEAEFSVRARVDNDANVAALGEYRFGAGFGCDSLFYITISTGVGGGWILNGHPWRGAGGMAGEIGHTVVDPNGPECLCGKRGCVERLASGPYIARDIIETLQTQPAEKLGGGDILQQLVDNHLESITAQTVSQAAQQGDELARQALEKAGWALGVGIGNAANFVNPQRFVLGGGVTKSGEIFWEAVRRAARETALPEVEFEIVPAALGDDAPLWGAIALAEDLEGTR